MENQELSVHREELDPKEVSRDGSSHLPNEDGKEDEGLVKTAKEVGESSQISCEICAEEKITKEMLRTSEKCQHKFCVICITKHFSTKIQENVTNILCPGLGCRAPLEIVGGPLRDMLPQDVVYRWERAKCEDLFLETQKCFCPFMDCSVMLIKDDVEEKGQVVRECECPYCHRLFCAQCLVPWHVGVMCEEFQLLHEDERGREDLMLRELAKEKKWGRCPRCKFYVERTAGCPHITCRCQFQFCYGCEREWNDDHGGCSKE